MPYYAVVHLKLKDDSWIADYLPNVTEIAHKHGGRYLARTPEITQVEGQDAPDVVALIEWPSKEAAEAFYNDPDYQPYLKNRLDGTDSQFLLVKGEDILNKQ